MAVDTENNQDFADSKNEENPMKKLEEALLICGFGKFHLVLQFATFCAVAASMLGPIAASYILPIAECDLGMTIMQKGILTAMPFFGQVGTILLAGLVTDVFGRKRILVGGHFGIFVCTILEGSSQNYWVLLTGKFAEGVFISAIVTVSLVMVSEFTHKEARDRSLLAWSAYMSITMIVAALMSWATLPQDWHFVIWKGYFEIHSWNIYLYFCSIWSLLGGIIYYVLPESPKFLLSKGHEAEALEVLKKVYATNTGNDKNSFPVTSLKVKEDFKYENRDGFTKKLVEAMFEMKTLFRQPLLGRLCLFVFINFFTMFSFSPLRLWYPQISTIIENYEINHGSADRFCVMIDDYTHGLIANSSTVTNGTEICVPHISGTDTYLNGIMMGCAILACFFIKIYSIKLLGHKPLIIILWILGGAASGSLYWTNSLIQIAILLSATSGFMLSAAAVKYNMAVRVFPTSIRSLTFSLVSMSGRIGLAAGSIVFPVMLQSACMSPFLSLSVVCLCVAVLVIFLPNPNKENNGTGDR